MNQDPAIVQEDHCKSAVELWLWMLAGLVMAFAFTWVMPVTYEVSDDIGAEMILAGDDGFDPAPQVPFLTFTLNGVFFQLYQLAPQVPWYGILLVATQALGLALLGYCFNAQLAKHRWLAMLVPFLMAFAFYSLLTLTFTKAALTLEFGVFSVLLLQQLKHQQATRQRQILLSLLLLLALLWRWKLGLLCLVFAAPLALFANGRWWRSHAYPLICVLALIGIDRGVQRATQSPQWSRYMEFYSLRAELFDMPGGRTGGALQQVAAAADWCVADYELIRNHWMLHDERLANPESFERFLTASGEASTSSPMRQGWRHLRDNALLLYAFIPLLLAILIFRGSDWFHDELLQRILWACLLLTAPLIFLVFFRMVPRVTMPSLLYGVLVLIMFIEIQDQGKSTMTSWLTGKANPMQMLALILLALSGWHCFELLRYQWNDAVTKRSAHIESEALLTDLPQPVTLLRMSPAALPGWEGCHPLQRINTNPNLRFIPAGWQIGSPRYDAILHELGYSSGSDMLQSWGQKQNSTQYFLRRLQRTASTSQPLSPVWTAYFQKWHPQRSLDQVTPTFIKLGSGDQLSLIQITGDDESDLRD